MDLWSVGGGIQASYKMRRLPVFLRFIPHSTPSRHLKQMALLLLGGNPGTGGDSGRVASSLSNVVSFANPLTDDKLIFDATHLPELAIN